MKHKHYDCIVAWAEGKTIQFRCAPDSPWLDCPRQPKWALDHEYRVKPDPKPDTHVTAHIVMGNVSVDWGDNALLKKNVKFTFDGETGKLKSIEII